ncbi:MAG: LOG family protein [Candidatus Methylacidiphilales bacterium]|nr:hypothetical protein [Candidatus Methylacidiphilales bacterium]
MPHDQAIASLPQAEHSDDGCLFLGCKLGPRLSAVAAAHHALIFPKWPGRPFDPFRSSFYTPKELFKGFIPSDPESYFNTPDWQSYISYIKVDKNNKPFRPTQYVEAGPDEVLARRLHDHFMEEETEAFLQPFRRSDKPGAVAIMGGHNRLRSDAIYLKIARIARTLTQKGYLIVSGGGPGLMEAANLGAYFAAWDSEAPLLKAIEKLKEADRYDNPEWLVKAWEVWKANPTPDITKSRSLGVPTWFYGHEPPNLFATHIAKYFENSLREEGLLAIANDGVIFAEGNAGTVQEIFQDACQNYYTNYEIKSPMILLDEEYWNPSGAGSTVPGAKPAWALLGALASEGSFDQRFRDLMLLTNDTDKVLKFISDFTKARCASQNKLTVKVKTP